MSREAYAEAVFLRLAGFGSLFVISNFVLLLALEIICRQSRVSESEA